MQQIGLSVNETKNPIKEVFESKDDSVEAVESNL
jgi:hypothetical protein